jgi:transposase-like protein
MMGFLVLGVQFMILLSDHQIRKLLENPNVEEITEKHIHFTPEFKIRAVELNLKGTSPEEIFQTHGFDLSLFTDRYAVYAIKRWRKKYNEEGKSSLNTSQSGTKATGRPKKDGPEDYTKEELWNLLHLQRDMIIEIKKQKALAKKKK